MKHSNARYTKQLGELGPIETEHFDCSVGRIYTALDTLDLLEKGELIPKLPESSSNYPVHIPEPEWNHENVLKYLDNYMLPNSVIFATVRSILLNKKNDQWRC